MAVIIQSGVGQRLHCLHYIGCIAGTMDKTFIKILNLQSWFDLDELQRVQQRSLRLELEELPCKDELVGPL